MSPGIHFREAAEHLSDGARPLSAARCSIPSPGADSLGGACAVLLSHGCSPGLRRFPWKLPGAWPAAEQGEGAELPWDGSPTSQGKRPVPVGSRGGLGVLPTRSPAPALSRWPWAGTPGAGSLRRVPIGRGECRPTSSPILGKYCPSGVSGVVLPRRPWT